MHRRDLIKTIGTAGATGALTILGASHLGATERWARVPKSWPRVSDLQALLTAAIQKHNVPGASAAVFRDGKLTAAAAGLANVATGVDMTPDTIMHIGSITKVLNTTLLMQLVDEGRVDLETPLVKYHPSSG